MLHQFILRRKIMKHQIGNQNIIMGILLFSSIVIGISIYEMIPLSNLLSTKFTISATTAVQANSLFSLGYAIGFLTVTPLWKRFKNNRKLLFLNLLLASIVTVLLGFVNNFELFLILRVLQGIFSSFFGPIAFASVLKLIDPKRITFANSLITSGFVISSIVGQIYSTSIYQLINWQFIFIFQAVLLVIILLLLWHIIPSLPSPNGHVSISSSLKTILSNKILLKQYYITFTLLFSFVSMYALVSANNFIAINHIMQFRIYGLIGIITAIIILSKISGNNQMFALRLSLLSVSIGFIILSIVRNEVFLTIGSIIVAFGIVLSLPLVVSIIGSAAISQNRSLAIVLYTFILFIGATLGPIITNYLNQNFGVVISFSFLAVLTLIGALSSTTVKSR